MSNALELWLVRHGQTEWNAQNLICGWADVRLTPAGEEQARGLSALLSRQRFDRVWSSDLQRARETARLAIADPVQDQRLREFHFGEDEGLDWWASEQDLRDRIVEFVNYRPPGGECYHSFRERIFSFVEQLTPGRHLLFVHAGVVRVFLQEVDADEFLPPASVVGIDWTGKRLLQIHRGRTS